MIKRTFYFEGVVFFLFFFTCLSPPPNGSSAAPNARRGIEPRRA